MAQTIPLPNKENKLPIMDSWSDYMKYSQKIVIGLPNKIKYNISNWVMKVNLNVVELLTEARFISSLQRGKKEEKLFKVLVEIEKIKFIFQFLYEERYISQGQYKEILIFLLRTSKMTNGWVYYVSRK